MYPEEMARLLNAGDDYHDPLADAVSKPTKPYVEMSFGMGKDGYPAISMTQHAASKYCQWLSAKTGHFYRLPTEAEWEYACRAGTTTAFWFGDDGEKIGDYEWYADNADFKYQKVGTKKPNPWGLYDMHGNVAEWVIDAYDAAGYQSLENGDRANPFRFSDKLYPRTVAEDPGMTTRKPCGAQHAEPGRPMENAGSAATQEHLVSDRCPIWESAWSGHWKHPAPKPLRVTGTTSMREINLAKNSSLPRIRKNLTSQSLIIQKALKGPKLSVYEKNDQMQDAVNRRTFLGQSSAS